MTEQAPKRYAVVTGGNKGMGLEICRQLASKGVVVILTSRDEKKGVEAVEKLNSYGISSVVYHQLDVKEETSISSLVDFVATHFNKLDILVNNAANLGLSIDEYAFRALLDGGYNVNSEDPGILKGAIEQTYEKAEEGLETNYYGTKAVTEALLPFLQLSTSATIVNVSSAHGELRFIPSEKVKAELNNVANLTEDRLDGILQEFLKDFKAKKLKENGWPEVSPAYKVSKAAVNAYTRMLANIFPNMRINCVHPGYVKTDLTCNTGVLTAEEGAKHIVRLALMPDNGPSGQYFDQMEISSF